MGIRLKRLAALIRKEMVQLVRDRTTLGIMLAIPFIELFLFAYAVDMTVDHIPTAVADLSQDVRSRQLIKALELSGYFDVELILENEAQVIDAIDRGRVRAGLVIPPGLAAEVERGRGQVLILLDGSDSFTVQSGYSAAVAVVQDQALQLMAEKVGRLGSQVDTALFRLPIQTSTHILFNPVMDDLVFIVPAMAAMLLQLMTVNLTAMAVVRERELGTLEQLLVTPIRPMELMIAKMVPNVLLAAFGMSGVTLAGVFWFGVPFRGDPWLFAGLSVLFLVCGLGLGLLVSTVTRTQKEAQQVSVLLMLFSLLLTGFIYPRETMPMAVRVVGDLIPLTYFIRIVRGIFTKGVGLSFVQNDVVVLAIYAAVVMTVAAGTFQKRLD
jgi:ABC-2 type transport system permease protein